MEKLERPPAWNWEERKEEMVDEPEWPEAEDAEELGEGEETDRTTGEREKEECSAEN